jgi:hypothetical protein
MSGDEELSGDDTAPRHRPEHPVAEHGVDPLLVSPAKPIASAEQIHRPGAHSPRWLVPVMFLGFALFMVGLVVVTQSRRDDGADATLFDGPEASLDTVDAVDGAVRSDSSVTASSGPGTDVAADSGSVRVSGELFAITAQCEVQQPFAPLDSDYGVSSYAFVDADGKTRVIDRIFDDGAESATFRAGEFEFVAVEPIGEAGAFSAVFSDLATFAETAVVVTPAANASDCSDRLVTNEPGQFSEPHTRIVLDVCVDRTSTGVVIAGLTSQGARFAASQTSAESVDIAFRSGAVGATALRTASPGSIFVDADIVSVSGVVTDGTETLDISIDVGVSTSIDTARPCTDSDRL